MNKDMKTVFIKASSIRKGDVLRNGFVASEDAREVSSGRVHIAGTMPRVRGIHHSNVPATKVFEKVVL